MKNMMIYLTIFMHISLWGNLLDHIQMQDLYIKNSIATRKSIIHFIQNEKGVTYVVKQNKQILNGEFTTRGQFYTVRELYGSYLAQYLGLRSQQVCLIPAGVACIGKQYSEMLATLHTVVPGEAVKQNKKYKSIVIKQWAPGRKVSELELGLSDRVIKSMSKHKELPYITAFDTLACNNDRSRKNIYVVVQNAKNTFSDEADHFWIIDMDCCLSYNMAQVACEQLLYLDKTKDFQLNELIALNRYKKALQSYIQKCPLEKLYEIFDDTCTQCGFCEGGVFGHDKAIVALHRNIIKENYQDLFLLIEIIENIYKKHSKKFARLYNFCC